MNAKCGIALYNHTHFCPHLVARFLLTLVAIKTCLPAYEFIHLYFTVFQLLVYSSVKMLMSDNVREKSDDLRCIAAENSALDKIGNSRASV